MPVKTPHTETNAIRLACPLCKEELDRQGEQGICPHCGSSYIKEDGYWDMMPSSTREKYESFADKYSRIRKREGWSIDRTEYFNRLPYQDLSGNFTHLWKRRARHWKTFLRQVLYPLEERRQRPLKVLEAGTGNGWAANRLSKRGHTVWAVDVNADITEGLGAHRHYSTPFQSVRAPFNQLPFPKRVFDLVLFNGALHYTSSLEDSLDEALRVLRYGGVLVIMDTPVYEDESTGCTMVEEKLRYLEQLDAPEDLVNGNIHFLTFDELRDQVIKRNCNLRFYEPGLPWMERLRKGWRRLQGSRKEAEMPVMVICRRWPIHRKNPVRYSLVRQIKVAKLLWLVVLRLYIRVVKRFYYNRGTTEQIFGFDVYVAKQVFNPVQLRSGKLLAGALQDHNGLFRKGDTVLELGTGTGIGALAAARQGGHVVATDKNPHAVRCAQQNAARNGLGEKIEVREGDLFDPLDKEQFDKILFNPPYYYGTPTDYLDLAWQSENIPRRLAEQTGDYLAPDGMLLLMLSDRGEPEEFLWQLCKQGFYIEEWLHRDYVNEILTLYKITAATHDSTI